MVTGLLQVGGSYGVSNFPGSFVFLQSQISSCSGVLSFQVSFSFGIFIPVIAVVSWSLALTLKTIQLLELEIVSIQV